MIKRTDYSIIRMRYSLHNATMLQNKGEYIYKNLEIFLIKTSVNSDKLRCQIYHLSIILYNLIY